MNEKQCEVCIGDGCDLSDEIYCEYCINNNSLGSHVQKHCKEMISIDNDDDM